MDEITRGAAIAFLFAMLIVLLAHREGQINASYVRVLLVVNAAFSALFLLDRGHGVSGILILLLVPIGATECGYWAGCAVNAMLGEKARSEGEVWAFKNDKGGCLTAIVIAAALAYLMFVLGGSTDD